MSAPDPHAGSERETLTDTLRKVRDYREAIGADKPTPTDVSIPVRQGRVRWLFDTIEEMAAALLAAPSPSEERAATLEQEGLGLLRDVVRIANKTPGPSITITKAHVCAIDAALRALAPASPSVQPEDTP